MSWPLQTLDRVCEVNPRMPKGTDESQQVTFLKMASVSEKGQLLEQEDRVLSETKKGFTYFERNDVLLAKITPCFENGKAVHTSRLENPIGFGSTELHVLRAKPKLADGKYIFYLVWNDTFRFHGANSMKGAAGQKRVSADFLKQLKIPLPPLAQQKKIAAILDAADQLRQKDQQLIEHYTRLGQSLFLEMFGDPMTNPMGWEENLLGDYIDYLGDIGSNGSNAVIAKNLQMKDTIDYAIMVRTVNLNSNDFTRNVKYISQKTYDFFKKSKIHGGELIMNKIGSAGKFWIMPKLNYPVSLGLNQFVIRLVNLEMPYLFYYLSSGFGQQQIASRTRGAVTKSITKSQVRNIPLLSPPLELQNRFAQRIEAIEQQKQQAQANLAKSNDLFNSLLQRAFKGELTA